MHTIKFNKTLIYGLNTFEKIADLVQHYGQNTLIVTGQSSTKKSGVLSSLQELLSQSKIKYTIFDKVVPNPPVNLIDEAAELGRQNHCQVVIGIGGGSALDTAKACSAMITNAGSVEEYLEIGTSYKKVAHAPLPIIAIPTTAGTGSEATQNSVINAPRLQLKRSIRSELLMPEVAILDPKLIATAPRNVLASSAMDALTQLIEPFTGKKSQAVIDILALDGIIKISENLLTFIQQPVNYMAGMNMQLASYFSGLALANAGLGAVHALSRPFSGMYNLPHGLVCAILLPHITKLNYKHNIIKYAQVGMALGIKYHYEEKKIAEVVSEKIFELNRGLDIPYNFKQFKIPKNDIDKIIEDAQGSSLKNNPKDFTKEELKNLLLQLI